VDELITQGSFKDSDFATKCNDAYSLMLAANTTGLPLEDEGELLSPFRQMMHRVARRLNGTDWNDVLPTTDDFVVVSMDTIGYWLTEDLERSIPESKYAVLQKRGFLFDSN